MFFPRPQFLALTLTGYRCLHLGHPESSYFSSAPLNLFVQVFRTCPLAGNAIITMNSIPVGPLCIVDIELVGLDTTGCEFTFWSDHISPFDGSDT
ncbi:hypothetical protein EDD85DRAFT_505892 [Armillaria nabsnona]|nr:hypothetical protein EDD85DRAFT_505892 [Armillaria nabsnona]